MHTLREQKLWGQTSSGQPSSPKANYKPHYVPSVLFPHRINSAVHSDRLKTDVKWHSRARMSAVLNFSSKPSLPLVGFWRTFPFLNLQSLYWYQADGHMLASKKRQLETNTSVCLFNTHLCRNTIDFVRRARGRILCDWQKELQRWFYTLDFCWAQCNASILQKLFSDSPPLCQITTDLTPAVGVLTRPPDDSVWGCSKFNG